MNNLSFAGSTFFRACIFSTILVLNGIFVTSCSDNGNNPDFDEDYIQVINTEAYGLVFADGEGSVLYFFARDINGESMCLDACANTWPPFFTQQFVPNSGLLIADYGVISRPDGSSQLTYKGWPMYTFSNDIQPGDINGDGVNNLWYVAKPNYSLMVANGQLVGQDGNMYTSDYDQGEENTTFFTDDRGRTIYLFSSDEANTNTYTAPGLSNNDVWPIFDVNTLTLPSIMNEENFGETLVFNSIEQLTYKGWPLYYFGQDTQRGHTKGVSVPEPGVWQIINKDTPPAE